MTEATTTLTCAVAFTAKDLERNNKRYFDDCYGKGKN